MGWDVGSLLALLSGVLGSVPCSLAAVGAWGCHLLSVGTSGRDLGFATLGVPWGPCESLLCVTAPLCPRDWDLHPRDPISPGLTGQFPGIPITPQGYFQSLGSPTIPTVPVEPPVPWPRVWPLGVLPPAPGLQEPQVQHADHPQRHHPDQTGHPCPAVCHCVTRLPAPGH